MELTQTESKRTEMIAYMPIGKLKSVLMDEAAVSRSIYRMACEIIEKNKGVDNLVFIGIQKKGVDLAKAIRKCINSMEKIEIPLGSLDITFYRDDLTRLNTHPVIMGNDIAFPIEDKRIVLFDDVIYSGRTIRAAIEELFDMGRPKSIALAVLVDRGDRELPIQPDFVGKYVPSSQDEYINAEIKADGVIGRVTLNVREAL